MTWENYTRSALDSILAIANTKEADDLDKIICDEVFKRLHQYCQAVSLARIATALYKIAGLEDNYEESEYFNMDCQD